MTERVTSRDLARMTARTSLLQATWNYERQQGLGWAYCFAPVLERLYPDAAVRRARLAEHTGYFNTQPTLASVALGAVAHLEEQRAAGVLPEDDGILRVKSMLGSALAAVGDRLFWFTLRPFAALLGVWLALDRPWLGALALLACYNAGHLTLRVRGVRWGYALGPEVLGAGLRGNLERTMRTLAGLGSGLVGITVAALLVPRGDPQSLPFQATLAAGIALGMITAQRARPSSTQWALGAGALCLAAAWFR
ncbi:MAG TPA: PTS system mannose/fructose/sorbose family transporter subunit IID [Candidatus Eisenbacteria bacterium]|nr:PTS system mannose/fructose/sorbose family transporter subunit IID [Candidatus Eisenbacteria bacterium]